MLIICTKYLLSLWRWGILADFCFKYLLVRHRGIMNVLNFHWIAKFKYHWDSNWINSMYCRHFCRFAYFKCFIHFHLIRILLYVYSFIAPKYIDNIHGMNFCSFFFWLMMKNILFLELEKIEKVFQIIDSVRDVTKQNWISLNASVTKSASDVFDLIGCRTASNVTSNFEVLFLFRAQSKLLCFLFVTVAQSFPLFIWSEAYFKFVVLNWMSV